MKYLIGVVMLLAACTAAPVSPCIPTDTAVTNPRTGYWEVRSCQKLICSQEGMPASWNEDKAKTTCYLMSLLPM